MALLVFKLLKNKLELDHQNFRQGIEQAELPGRFQIIERKNKAALILDGAHNIEAARSLIKNIKHYYPDKKITFIVGLLKRKDPKYINEITKLASHIIITAPDSQYHQKDKYTELLKKKSSAFCQKLSVALVKADELTKSNDIICLTGSFYLVGEVYNYAEIRKQLIWGLALF